MPAKAVRARLFGSPSVEVEGMPISISRHKALALFAFLACNVRSYTREYLAAMFWPESDSARARAGLRQSLAELTRTLGHDMLATVRGSIGINPRVDLHLDVREFRELYEATVRDLPASRAEDLERGVVLATPEFMEGFSLPDCPVFDEWQFNIRSTLRAQLFEMIKKLIEVLRQDGQIARAADYGRKLVSLDPLDEENQHLFMRLLTEAGDRRGAMQQFRLYSRKLRDELGVEPDEQIIEFYEQIQRTPMQARADHPKQAGAVHKLKVRIAGSSRSLVIIFLVLSVLGIAAIGWARGWFGIRGPSPQTLAVLPVKPWCGDPEAEGYCEVMTHELITALAGSTALKVTPQASVRQYRSTAKRIPLIARELEVRYVLDVVGYREGGTLLFSVQLIHAGRDECIWADVYSGDVANPLAEQQRIIREITEQVRLQLLSS